MRNICPKLYTTSQAGQIAHVAYVLEEHVHSGSGSVLVPDEEWQISYIPAVSDYINHTIFIHSYLGTVK